MTSRRFHTQPGAMVEQVFLAAGLTVVLMSPQASAQVTDPTGIKRAFLDRYLECAEAPDAGARLDCYDLLLLDIPAWLDDAADQPLFSSPTGIDRAVQTSDRREGCEGRGTAD
ncbi:hypothetical protein ACFQ3C_05850 [Seohaeicola saemankumensis]|uniref:Uncharacterized protein n=1 Tax=Seohaeicola saemankumensis TaxID=481181 RepID=A0ABW3TBP9_9RHOB